MKSVTYLLLSVFLLSKCYTIHADDENVIRKTFPFFAQLELAAPVKGSKQTVVMKVCGATLIHKQWLLSAGQCFHPFIENLNNLTQGNYLEVYMGSSNRFDKTASINYIKKVIIHPKYWQRLDINGDLMEVKYDVALAMLKHPYRTNNNIQMVYLPDPKLSRRSITSGRCKVGTVVGLGRNKNKDMVMFANVTSDSKRPKELPDMKTPTVFYSKSNTTKYTPFQGHYGGPYVCYAEGIPIQYGIVSRAKYIAHNLKIVAVYEAVDENMDFILKYVSDVKNRSDKIHQNKGGGDHHKKNSSAIAVKGSLTCLGLSIMVHVAKMN